MATLDLTPLRTTTPAPNTRIDINDNRNKQLYNSKWWKDARKRKLQETPLCEECLKKDKITPATEVHHIIPFLRMGAAWELYAYNYYNLESLCEKCHIEKHQKLKNEYGKTI